MRLENSCQVPAGVDEVWDVMLDVPRIVPCMPGAELVELVDDSTWKARVRVKLGPMALTFDSEITREQVDVEGRRVRLDARGREVRGRGEARASVDSALVAIEDGTRVDILTNLTLSGAVAQYGRGVVQDISSELVDQFADRLSGELSPESSDGSDQPIRANSAPAPPLRGLRLLGGVLWPAIIRLINRLWRGMTRLFHRSP